MSCFIRSGNVGGSGGDILGALPWGGVLFCLIVLWGEVEGKGRQRKVGLFREWICCEMILWFREVGG